MNRTIIIQASSAWICIALSIIFLAVACSWSTIFSGILRKNLVLTPNSTSFSMWVETPLPMYLDIYLFNWTNAADYVADKSLKPRVEEIGPFVFREIHDRVNISWDDNFVSYNQTRKWTFVPDESVDLNVSITNLNVIALAAARSTRYANKFIKLILNLVLQTTSMYVTRPAGQWLFEGMDLPLLQLLNLPIVKKNIHFDLPIPDKFGFFYERNMSAAYDGHFKVGTGIDHLGDLGAVHEWNYQNKTNFFQSYCAMVNGSSGEIFPPVNGADNLTLFISDVCSSLILSNAGKTKIEGLTGQAFVGDETMFDNGQLLPERKCFCEGECIPSGVRNLTRCRQGAPVFASFPHFYLADPSYGKAVDGLNPDKKLHEFKLVLEPITGIPLEVQAQLQVNALLEPNTYSLYKNVSRLFMPLLWFRQRARIQSPIESEVFLIVDADNYVPISLFLLFASFVVFAVLIVFYMRKTHMAESIADDEEPVISSPDDVS